MTEKISIPEVSAGWMFVRLVVAFAIVLVGVIAIGAVLPVLFWGAWQWIFGSIPKIMGFSRLWFDAIFAGPCMIVVIIYGIYLLVLLDSNDYGPKSMLFRVLAFFWIVDIIVSIVVSAVVGFAATIALAIIIGIGWAVYALFHVFGETQGLTEWPDN